MCTSCLGIATQEGNRVASVVLVSLVLVERQELENLDPELMRAAGGVIVRINAEGHVEFAVCHRPERSDWSFPKGKLDGDETFEQAALREVEEETGLVCRMGPFIGTTQYVHRKGRNKVVAYWAMTVVAGEFVPNDEVDQVVWCDLSHAELLLTYPRDRELLPRTLEVLRLPA